MADSLTLTYDFVLPEVGASDDTWGTKLNANFTKLDLLLESFFINGTVSDLGDIDGGARIFGGSPTLTFTESDQAAPVGRFRWVGAGGVFALQRALTGEFTTAEEIMRVVAGDYISVLGPYSLHFNQVRIAEQPDGTHQPNVISVIPDSNILFATGGTGRHYFQIDNTNVARIGVAGNSLTDDLVVVTREKGDARYAQQSTVGAYYASVVYDGVGTIGMMWFQQGNAQATVPGQVRSGSVLRWCPAEGSVVLTTPPGSWMCLGEMPISATGPGRTTIWKRIA